MSDKGYPTSLGTSTADEIRLMGQNLTAEIMGQVSFTELAYRLVTLRQPTPGQVRMLDTVLASLADHGFTPTAMSARLTYLSAPDSLQGAVAAGILGGGSRFLGVTEDSGAFLAATLGACTKKDSGIGGDGDAAAIEQRQLGEGNSSAAGVVGGTGNTGNAGLSSTEYDTNVTPRTVGENDSTDKKSLGASGGASGVDMVAPDQAGPGANGSSGTRGTGATGTGGMPQAGATPGAAPSPETGQARGAGTKASGHTGDTTGTGPASTKTDAGR